MSRRIKIAIWLCVGGAFALMLLLWIGERPYLRPAANSGAAAALDKSWLDERAIVVVDAGHGGLDPGAVTASGTILETDITQLMAERVMAKLALHSGELEVVQAHSPGTYATPMARANTAARLEADVLVSLHLNADVSEYTRGFSVFPTPPGRVHHKESLRLAQQLVARAAETGVSILGQTGVYYAYYLDTGGYPKVIYDAADAPEPRDDESFGVVEYPGCPAVLVEMWHLSSPADMLAFNNEAGHEAMAQAVYLALCDYLGLLPLAG